MSLDCKAYTQLTTAKPNHFLITYTSFVLCDCMLAKIDRKITACCMRSRKNTTFSLERKAENFHHHSIHLPNFVFKSKLNLVSRMIFPNQNNLQSLSSSLIFSSKNTQSHTLTYPIIETTHSGKRTVSVS